MRREGPEQAGEGKEEIVCISKVASCDCILVYFFYSTLLVSFLLQ